MRTAFRAIKRRYKEGYHRLKLLRRSYFAVVKNRTYQISASKKFRVGAGPTKKVQDIVQIPALFWLRAV